jgi:hypothetical protein
MIEALMGNRINSPAIGQAVFFFINSHYNCHAFYQHFQDIALESAAAGHIFI